jgi:hypothetical protein
MYTAASEAGIAIEAVAALAAKRQTATIPIILAPTVTFKFDGQLLPTRLGFPMRIRIPTKLGFKKRSEVRQRRRLSSWSASVTRSQPAWCGVYRWQHHGDCKCSGGVERQAAAKQRAIGVQHPRDFADVPLPVQEETKKQA